MSLRARLADLILGPCCPVCDQRVYPRDQATHDETQHPGGADMTNENGPTVTDPTSGEPTDGGCAKHSDHWMARAVRGNRRHLGLSPQECEYRDECPSDGCDCTELCSMGPTCPGGMLAGLPGSGCWRTRPDSNGGAP